MTETVNVNINDLVTAIVSAVNMASAGAGAQAANAAASAGTARTTSNAEQDAKDAFKRSFVADQADSDIGGEEGHESLVHDQTSAWSANRKRTYDLHQTIDLEELNNKRHKADVLFQLSTQALQNAVETANLVGKQAVRHTDIAIDREWNIDEVSNLSAKTGVQTDALASALAAAVADKIKS